VTRFVLAFALLCVPTALMGATLPVLGRYVAQSRAVLGWRVGTLYALNTAGAVLGCFAAGYVLLGRLGVSETVWIGAALNLAIALVVWIGQRWAPEKPLPGTTVDTPSGAPPAAAIYDRTTVRRVLWCFGLAGFTALAYEVLWTRALTFFIGNSTYAFSAMLTTFLCGLALGSLLFARLSDRRRDLLALLGALQVAIGIYGLLSIAILGRLFYGLDAWWEGFSNAHWGTAPWLTFVKTFAVILPPTLCMGAAFPLVVKIVAHGPRGVGRGIGNAYAANTLGAIAGA
jgi:spermidine synthase